VGLKARMLNTKTIWRLEFLWSRKTFQVYWLADREWSSFWQDYRYTTHKPILLLGEIW